MREELNLSSPYDFTNNNFNYSFITNSGVEYSAYFLAAAYFETCPDLDDQLMSFGFSPRENKARAIFLDSNYNLRREKKIDLRVRNTIIHIIEVFLTNYPEKAIISICDNRDAREYGRHKLFRNWYNQMSTINTSLW